MLDARVRWASLSFVALSALACSSPFREKAREEAKVPSAGAVPAAKTPPDVFASTVAVPSPASREEALDVPVHEFPRSLSRAELAFRLAHSPDTLGSLSIGKPNRGALWNGLRMPDGPLWEVVDPKHAFGTEETIRSIALAVEAVNAQHPGTPKIYVGQISAEHGGYLRPHRSHQAGRDVDLGYYYLGGPKWYARATAGSLDRMRTWALVKTLAQDPNVEAIFMDRSVMSLLRDYAEDHAESPAWLNALFDARPGPSEAMIRHEWGHTTHLHVRFRSEHAQEGGLLSHTALLALRKIPPRKYY